MKKIANNTLNIILVAVLATMLISGMILISGCKGGDVAIDEAAAPEGSSDAVEVTEADEDSNGEEQDEDSDGVEEEAEDGQTEEEQDIEEEAEEIPVEIIEEIEVADNYFDEGMYAEAAKEYRDAARMIDDADISQGLKDELLAGISQRY